MKLLKLTLLLISMMGLTACGFFDNQNKLGSGSDEVFCTDASCDTTGLSSYEAVPVETFAVLNQNQVLKSMISCTGLTNVDNATRNLYEGSKNSFSLEGEAESVGAPMWMAITSLAGEVCDDLVAQEAGQSADQRRIFSAIDFSQGPANINALQVASVTANMARSCWGRDASSKEREIINTAFFGDPADNNDDTFSGNNTQETRRAATFLCAGILASLSANQM